MNPTSPNFQNEVLRRKRLKLGLTLEEAGRLLGVHYTTIRLWEDGRAVCRPCHMRRLQAFLAGHYDRMARPLLHALPARISPTTLPDELASRIARLTRAIAASSARPQLRARLLARISALPHMLLQNLP
ncbi:MAG: helix-turn-helix transcriptional regulator [Victivallales bacterium]|nr:helix-turn-helix transcriptional regulator [Victivallales bacterium]